MELDNYIVKEAIICAPILLLVRYTANQRWGYGGFTLERDLCFMLKCKKKPERARAYARKCFGTCNCLHEKQFLAPGLGDMLQQEGTTHSLFAVSRRTLFYG